MVSFCVITFLCLPVSYGTASSFFQNNMISEKDYATVYVDDDFNESTPGWQIDHFDRIQDGVIAVSAKGTVQVYAGTYLENVMLDKPLSLLGESNTTTIIDANSAGSAVYVSMDHSIVSGFLIRHGGSCSVGTGIKIHAENTLITNNTFLFCNNTALLIAECGYNTIFGNTFLRNRDAITLSYGTNNTITNNLFIENEAGMQFRFFSNGNLVSENCFRNNLRYGININTSESQSWCNDSRFYHNNFFENPVHARDTCTNFWDDGYPSGGNYWDEYTGVDAFSGTNQDQPGADGIGDTPYDFPCEHAVDRYPLMFPYGTIPTVLSLNITGGIGVHYRITNIGEVDAENVLFSFSMEGGLLARINITRTNSVSILTPDTEMIGSGLPIGFGRILIQVTAQATNAQKVTKTAEGFLFLFFVSL